MIDDATLAALRERVHARPDVRRALAAEQDAAPAPKQTAASEGGYE